MVLFLLKDNIIFLFLCYEKNDNISFPGFKLFRFFTGYKEYAG